MCYGLRMEQLSDAWRKTLAVIHITILLASSGHLIDYEENTVNSMMVMIFVVF
jgi:hypothetical protein